MIFSVSEIAFEVLGYPVSFIELAGVLLNLISVILASRVSKLTWPVGLAGCVLLSILFYQVQLYSDMVLQAFFMYTSIYGWYTWQNSKDLSNKVIRSVDSTVEWFIVVAGIVVGSLHIGFFFEHLNEFLPRYFKLPAAYPYFPAFVFVSSIIATFLLIKKAIETWYLWIIVDLVASVIYFERGVYFLAFEYILFLGTAMYGLLTWQKQLNANSRTETR